MTYDVDLKMDRYILIVEPEHLIAQEIQVIPGENNYIVRRSSGLTDTWKALLQKTPDLIIADTTIKEDQDGFNKVLSLWKEWNLPVIYISTKTQADIVKESGIKIIGMFSKPFDADNLLFLVDLFFKAKILEDHCTVLTETLEDSYLARLESSKRISICLFDALDPNAPIDSVLAS